MRPRQLLLSVPALSLLLAVSSGAWAEAQKQGEASFGTRPTAGEVGQVALPPAPPPQPSCKASYDAELLQVAALVEEFAVNGWSQGLQNRLDALVGPGFTFFDVGSESMALEPVVFQTGSDFFALQAEIDYQQTLSSSQLTAYLAAARNAYLCHLFPAKSGGPSLSLRWIGLINYMRAMAAQAAQGPPAPPPLPPPPAWPWTPPPPEPPPWTDPFHDNCFRFSVYELSRSTTLDVFICHDEDGGFGGGIGITFRF